MAELLFWISLSALLYVFIGYPVILLLVGKVIQSHLVLKAPICPRVTLIISAYNEEQVIEKKLQNALALDYPRDLLEIIVVSDASTDQTDDIVKRYVTEGIILKRMPARRGKTEGLNEVVPVVSGVIIVFSDANIFYQPDVIRKLVRNFADPNVGCVTGNSCYVDSEASNSGKNESNYWAYERNLKIGESAIGSLVGSDGAIFAVRKELFNRLEADDINDFVTPLQIVSQGYRNVFEPDAIGYESSVSNLRQEFRRKVRIVSRSWKGLFRVRKLLNPWRYGWFSVELISHKMLRWLTPAFLALLLVSSFFLASDNGRDEIIVAGQLIFYSVGALCMLLDRAARAPFWLSLPGYFLAVNAASAVGTVQYAIGKRIVVWEPERPAATDSDKKTLGMTSTN